MPQITVYHLYPDHLNLYGDRGNVLALLRRARWHGLSARLVPVRPGYKTCLKQCDILFMGGGQDTEQKMVCRDFQGRRLELIDYIQQGMVILAICGSFQLLGRSYTAADGEEIPGMDLFNFHTDAGQKRMIGDIVTRCTFISPTRTLVGFENHSGRTILGPNLQPLGSVVKGYGNNGSDRTEGMIYKNVIGTYLHGALLPKNPWLADYLLQKALQYQGLNYRLPKMDNTLEDEAHQFIIHRCRSLLFRRRNSAMG
jgi:lipid II isoglutaminyl synthase (glutamine-hydrolysing)